MGARDRHRRLGAPARVALRRRRPQAHVRLVSRYGLIAFASSLDTVGTFTRSVRDAAVLLGAIAGKDPRDATSLDAPVPDYLHGLEDGIAGLRVGVDRRRRSATA